MQEREMTSQANGALRATFYQGNLLNPVVRREIADLNRLFLERALVACHEPDAWFCLPGLALARLAAGGGDALEHVAQCPIALFEVRLPSDVQTAPLGATVTVEAADAMDGGTRVEARRSFGVTALGVLRRLVDGIPLAPRIAFGLEEHVETRLAAMTLAESYRVAAWPGLIRPRWHDNERYWALLADAVARTGGVHWAYSAGLCLLAQCERQPAAVAYGAPRKARPTHRRAGSGGVSC
jgi:hypothetical protein